MKEKGCQCKFFWALPENTGCVFPAHTESPNAGAAGQELGTDPEQRATP